MVTYYQGRTAHITDEVFEVRGPQAQRFRIADLRDVYVVKRDRGPVSLRFGITTTLAFVAVATSWLFLGSAASWVSVAALVAAPTALGLWRHRSPAEWVLLATYRTHPVELYRCADVRTFGQVKRGLQRALERLRGW